MKIKCFLMGHDWTFPNLKLDPDKKKYEILESVICRRCGAKDIVLCYIIENRVVCTAR